ncbi:MAG: thioredoxin domain-containing protein [Elusimicrobiota bacterium]|mgnify:CR=1 FL=1
MITYSYILAAAALWANPLPTFAQSGCDLNPAMCDYETKDSPRATFDGSAISSTDPTAGPRAKTTKPPLKKYAKGHIRPIEATDFSKEVLNAKTMTIGIVWKSDCQDCSKLMPAFEALAAKYQGRVKFVSINNDSDWLDIGSNAPLPMVMIASDKQVMMDSVTGSEPAEFVASLSAQIAPRLARIERQKQIKSGKKNFFTIKLADFSKDALGSTLPAFVEFSAAWCQPCHMLAPAYKELADEYKGKAVFYTIDIGDETSVLDLLGSIPMIVAMHQGKMEFLSFSIATDKRTGEVDKTSTKASLRKHVDAYLQRLQPPTASFPLR